MKVLFGKLKIVSFGLFSEVVIYVSVVLISNRMMLRWIVRCRCGCGVRVVLFMLMKVMFVMFVVMVGSIYRISVMGSLFISILVVLKMFRKNMNVVRYSVVSF